MGSTTFTSDVMGIRPELRYISRFRYENDWQPSLRADTSTQILYFSEGKGRMDIGDESHDVQSDDFAVLAPNTSYMIERSSDEDPLEYYVVGIGNAGAEICPDGSPIIRLGDSRSTARRLITTIYREMQDNEKGNSLLSEGLLYELIVLISRRRDDKADDGVSSDMAELRQYMDDHYAEDIDLTTLSNISSISRFHLVRKFRKETGNTPMEYLGKRRISEACSLLASTEMSISAIASSIGFSSSSYFSERFRKETGIPPTRFRNEARG